MQLRFNARSVGAAEFSQASIALSVDGKRVVGTGPGNLACVWDTSTGKKLVSMNGNSASPVSQVATDATGLRVLTYDDEADFNAWNLNLKANLDTSQKMAPLQEAIADSVIAISGNGKRIATGNYRTNIISVWEADTGFCLQTIEMQKTTQNFLQATIFGYIVDTVMNRVDHLALSANGSRLVSGSTGRSGGTVCVWDTNTGECQHILKDPQGHRNPVWANALVDISANGKIIVSCCADNKVKVWNGDTGALLKTLRGIMDNLNTLAISADGLYIVSGSGQVRLWETSTGEVLKIFNTRSGSYARPAASVAVAHQYWTRQTHRRSSSTELMLITAIASGNRSDVVLPEHVWEYVFKFLSGSLVVAYAAYTDIEINFF